MLTRRFLSPLLCSTLLALAACDKEESLGEVESETAAESESESDSAAESESDTGETEGESDSDATCTDDVMICPDGTPVSRSGPECEFDPCPGESGGEPPPDACPGEGYYEPASCPMDTDVLPYIIDPGCYTGCDPEAADACDDTSVCMVVEINPCICSNVEGEDCCGACSSADALCIPVVSGEACDNVAGNYLTLEEYECGIAPDGVVMCQWQVNLEEDGTYLWMYSDIGQGGNYACKDGVITLDNNPSHSATYDSNTGTLTWDDIVYTQVD
ncbi:MAG: hypothetical protein ACRBN8_24895 [Nannocystales bacterium]